jgi:uncharacterized protein (DUF58 family)
MRLTVFKIIDAIKKNLQERYRKAIDRRIPIGRAVTLDQRRIFILPSTAGWGFILLLLVMLAAAVNYENNMAFALVFFLASLFVVAIIHTFANLSGLTITALHAGSAYVGDKVGFTLQLSRFSNKTYFDVELSWPESETVAITLSDQSDQTVQLHLLTKKRGRLRPKRLYVRTLYPLGLLRAWSWVALDLSAIVYPKPLACDLTISGIVDNTDGDVVPVAGGDDFYEFKAYQVGDSLKRVFWKSYAKGQPLQTKHYAANRDKRLWLDWEQFNGGVEQRLQHICYWVLELEKTNNDYGLKIPGVEIVPSHGEAHKTSLLTALALFNYGSQSSNTKNSSLGVAS